MNEGFPMTSTTAPAPASAPVRRAGGGISVFDKYLWKRLFAPGRLRKVMVERLNEPVHLNVAALFVALLGNYRTKVDFDLIIRPQYAYPILLAADIARQYNVNTVTIAEFGVASGAGLLNMCKIAEATTAATGINFEVVGFDTGTGMPPGIDYRDHPERFQPGDFPMDADKLRRALPPFARLVLGPIAQTAPTFLSALSPDKPLGFVSVDVDYYSSAVDVLKIFEGAPDKYLPYVPTYVDDIVLEEVNPWCGELLAIEEFNARHEKRKLAPVRLLRAKRLFKNPLWIDQIYFAHIFDHATRTFAYHSRTQKTIIPNEFME